MKFLPLAKTQYSVLPNGLQVYLKPDRQAPLVSAQAWIGVGSVDEKESESGLSHVLEHMLFKGTEQFRADHISRWIESLGGSLNAETSREYTHYYIDVPSAGAHQAVTLLSELLYKATLDEPEWVRECPVILEEIKRRNDDPESLLWDLLNETLFTSPRLRQPVIGSPGTVASVSAAQLREFYQRHYRGDRTILVVAGDFEVPTMKRWIEAAFKSMPGAGRPREPFPKENTFRPESRRQNRPVQQSYAAFGFPTPPAQHPHQEALDVLAAVLADGRCSRLVDRMREAKNLVWSVNAVNMTHQGPGMFVLLFECDGAKRAAATEEMYRILRALRRNIPGEQELRRAKNLLQTAWLQGYETCHNQAATIGSFAIDGDVGRLKKYLERVLSIERRDLADVIDVYFGDVRLSSSVIEAA